MIFVKARGHSTGGNSEPAWSDGIDSFHPMSPWDPTPLNPQNAHGRSKASWYHKNLIKQINIVFQGRYYFLLYFLKSRARLSKVAHQTLFNNFSLRLGDRVIKFLPLNVHFSSWQIPLTSYFYSYFPHPIWHLIMLISKYFLNMSSISTLSMTGPYLSLLNQIFPPPVLLYWQSDHSKKKFWPWSLFVKKLQCSLIVYNIKSKSFCFEWTIFHKLTLSYISGFSTWHFSCNTEKLHTLYHFTLICAHSKNWNTLSFSSASSLACLLLIFQE